MSEENEGYKNSETLTKWVRYFLYIQIVVAGVSLLSNYMEYQLLSDYQNGVYESQERAVADGEANDQRQGLIGMAYLAIFIVSGFLILKWIYRASYNARQLGAKDMRFTPGWSVGWYFVPIFALWKPYQAMKEIWRASHNPSEWSNAEGNALLGWWWFFWIVSNVISQASFKFSMRAEDLSELIALNMVNQAAEVFSISLAFVTLALVNRIYAAQLSHVQKIS